MQTCIRRTHVLGLYNRVNRYMILQESGRGGDGFTKLHAYRSYLLGLANQNFRKPPCTHAKIRAPSNNLCYFIIVRACSRVTILSEIT